VESENGGKGGRSWVNDHIDSFISIATPMLGVPKAVSSVLSGEMKDTAELNSVLQLIKENLISKNDLLTMFRSFGSIPSMFPKGGDAIWGDGGDSTPDNITGGHLLTFIKEETGGKSSFAKEAENRDDMEEVSSCPSDHVSYAMEKKVIDAAVRSRIGSANYTLDEAYELLESISPEYMERVKKFYSFGVADNPSLSQYEDDSRYWANPMETALPNAPNMKIYCIYGIGKDTERSYYYTANNQECSGIPITINTKISNMDKKLSFGVQLTEGDGTVPLISLGYMCVRGWKDPKFNPSNMKIITREYQHTLQSLIEARSAGLDAALRGGITTADHVDIMGNHHLLEDALSIAAGKEVEDRIYSNVEEYSRRVVWK